MRVIRFGTDGVRGVANTQLSVEVAMGLGQAAARAFREAGMLAGVRPAVVVGRDTRRSGPMLEAALSAGLASEGLDVISVGVLPTPAVAYLVRHWGCCAGAVISASHNPAPDNGIKFFSGDGFKLPEALESRIEALCNENGPGDDVSRRPSGAGVGSLETTAEGVSAYADFLVSTVREDFTGWPVVIDCAHGAASTVAPRVFSALGCRVETLHAQPDGMNINVNCGSTRPDVLREAVRVSGARLGLAFDGDADRVIAVDENGELVDGDAILAICGGDLLERGELAHRALAATVYSNLGLVEYMNRLGAKVITTAAGDRSVLEALIEHDLVLGGEQSGHIIFLHHTTTGDGLVTALQLMQVMARRGQPLSELVRPVPRFPQILENVPLPGSLAERRAVIEAKPVQEAIARAEERLEPLGRVFVRPSGTEPVVRVMGEGKEEGAVRRAVEEVVAALQAQWAKQAPGLSAGAAATGER